MPEKRSDGMIVAIEVGKMAAIDLAGDEGRHQQADTGGGRHIKQRGQGQQQEATLERHAENGHGQRAD